MLSRHGDGGMTHEHSHPNWKQLLVQTSGGAAACPAPAPSAPDPVCVPDPCVPDPCVPDPVCARSARRGGERGGRRGAAARARAARARAAHVGAVRAALRRGLTPARARLAPRPPRPLRGASTDDVRVKLRSKRDLTSTPPPPRPANSLASGTARRHGAGRLYIVVWSARGNLRGLAGDCSETV